MALTVFAEKMGFFHKGCAGIGVAPLDVCLTPPGVPVPYTNVLFAKDLIKGSKTVRIDGEPTFLEDYSETSTSIGDEPGSLGSVVTGVHLGKGYFMVWSMTVYIEGLGVCRHGDMMGQNSASAPPSSIDAAAIAQPANVSAPVPGPVASRRAAEAKVLDATGPGDSEPAQVTPCDFETIAVKCKHCGKDRDLAAFEYTYSGQIEDNLPRPEPPSKRTFTPNIQLVAGEDERRADTLEVELSGGPGYGCGKSHPTITLTDRDSGEIVKQEQGATKLSQPLTSKKLELPALAHMSPGAIIAYFYFSPKTTKRYVLEVASCGVLADQSPGFRKLSRQVDVFSSDKYKFSLSIPTLANREYKAGPLNAKPPPPNAQPDEDYDDGLGWDEGLKDGSDWFEENEAGEAPVNVPIAETGAKVKLTRNSEDIKATAKLGEIVQAFVNIQNEIQSVMNFIKDFQPQVGWKFTFNIGFFTGDLAFEWAAKEAKDHSVFRWWKFEAGLSLVTIELEASFGVDFRVWWARMTVLFSGKVSGEAKLNASCEATPDEPEWSTTLVVEIKGELSIKGALGADWVAAEGKLELGFPFEATPKIDQDEGLEIDWKLEFNGLTADLTGSIKFAGSFSRSWDIMDKRTLGEGSFPSGTQQDTGIKTPRDQLTRGQRRKLARTGRL